jgi:hypothetical protein
MRFDSYFPDDNSFDDTHQKSDGAVNACTPGNYKSKKEQKDRFLIATEYCTTLYNTTTTIILLRVGVLDYYVLKRHMTPDNDVKSTSQ